MMQQIGWSGPVDVAVREVIAMNVAHPRDRHSFGAATLVRNRNTGIYALTLAGVFRSVPYDWAREIHSQNQNK